MQNLFQYGSFTLHSGATSLWKIECDALTREDWKALAYMTLEILGGVFHEVEGVPRGGIPFAEELKKFVNPFGKYLLIVDDVTTTGASLEKHRAGRKAIGAVVFARGKCPSWVTPIFQMPKKR